MSSQPVRVRYAPSPTGEPHVGNIRTALFNWLFARRHGGAFIVRIEDTDRDRYIPGAVEAILESLHWLGLDWDEGPTGQAQESHGRHAPYFQSQRLPLYHEAAQQLVSGGHAYRCYCSPQRLEELRKQQAQEKRPPGYDRRCRDLTDAQRREMETQGTPSVVRFRVPQEGHSAVNDLVRGEVTWQNNLLDDFVILKSDGFPTYHLASVVDDHHMGISHVMRAEEWLPSTPRHLLLYQAFGWEPPLFAHLPMILGPDRAKLSKRHGATSVLAYREQGFLPEALFNFLVLLGWSLDDRTEVMSRETVVQHFSLERITKAGAIFNSEKLLWLNGVYIRQLAPEDLANRLVPLLERPASQGGLPDEVARPVDRDYLRRIVPLVQERLKALAEGAELTSFFFVERLEYDPALLVQKGMDREGTLRGLQRVLAAVEALASFDLTSLEAAIRPLVEELGVKAGQLFGAIRVATTGRTAAPPLFQTMEVLGRERCLRKLREAVAKLEATKA
ncbi:MAG: glutamate--tRNA ligase [Chloroflexi bacterium]|nr:glutamate--tRNA ligase [Chloroflexota bacterium]